MRTRWIGAALVVAALAVVAVVITLHVAQRLLAARLQEALGPQASIGSVDLGLSAITLHDVRVHGLAGWPTDTVFAAPTVVIEASLGELRSGGALVIHRIATEHAEVSLWRDRAGHLHWPVAVAPTATPAETAAARTDGQRGTALTVGQLEMTDARLTFYDEAVRRPAHRVVIHPLKFELRHLELPASERHIDLDIEGTIEPAPGGPAGELKVEGWLATASRSAEIKTHLAHVDLVAFEPYLVKATEEGVQRGTLDLDLDAHVDHDVIRAPGSVSISNLELAQPRRGALDTFMGVSRDLVLAGMRNHQGRIDLRFTLEGNLADPHFSLEEGMALRASVGMAQFLGVSVEGLARAAGGAGEVGLDAAGALIQGAGNVGRRVLHP